MAKKLRENRVPIMLTDEELKVIDDWRYANRVATRSDAIRRLAQMAVGYAEDAPLLLRQAIRRSQSFSALAQQASEAAGDNEVAQQAIAQLRAHVSDDHISNLSELLRLGLSADALHGGGAVDQTLKLAKDVRDHVNKYDLAADEDRDGLLRIVNAFLEPKAPPDSPKD